MKNIVRMSLLLSLFFVGNAHSQAQTAEFSYGADYPQTYLEKYTPIDFDLAAKKENTKTTIQFRDRVEAKREEDQLPEYFSGLATGGATGLFIALNWALAGLGAPFIGHATAITLVIIASICGMLCTYSTRLQHRAIRGISSRGDQPILRRRFAGKISETPSSRAG